METLNRSWMVILLVSFFFTLSRASLVRKKLTTSILKTIKSVDGDIIVCVDIYKQPAFDHPLLANHTLQMKPTDSIERKGSSEKIVKQSLQKNRAYCPKGTIPIPRHKLGKKVSYEKSMYIEIDIERAQVTIDDDIYYGASAMFSVNNPKVLTNEHSHAQVWVEAGEFEKNVIEAGWMVSHVRNSTDTRYFIRWTRDNYDTTGCFNLECSGFVQTSFKIYFGQPLAKLRYSIYDGAQYGVSIKIYKDMKNGNWWLKIQDHVMGYWPVEIFKDGGLATGGATHIRWGGEVSSLKKFTHTSTEMGSGHLAREGWGKAAFVQNMGYFDQDGIIQDANDIFPTVVTSPECYSVSIPKKDDNVGVYFFYGGPGYNDKCISSF